MVRMAFVGDKAIGFVLRQMRSEPGARQGKLQVPAIE